MQALVYTQPNEIQLQERPYPVATEGEVVLKIEAVGICGSDMHAFHGHDPEDADGDLLSSGLIVARHEIDYLTPLSFRPEPVAIDLWVSSVGGAHLEMDYEVLDDTGPDPVVYARAQSTMVAYTLDTGRPRRFTPSERELLQDWWDAPIRLRSRKGRR